MAVTLNRLKDYITTIPSGNYVVRLDYNANDDVEYVGYAPAGTSNDSASWRILKFYYNGSLLSGQRYADGDTNFNNSWTDRTTLTYV